MTKVSQGQNWGYILALLQCVKKTLSGDRCEQVRGFIVTETLS